MTSGGALRLFSGSRAIAPPLPSGCVGCGRDLTSLQPVAVFCPACGCRIPIPRTPRFTLLRHILQLFQLGRGNVPDVPMRPGRTAILIGYANAMYHLGWRYERGRGTPKNLPEAMRCYRKSAKLGNPDAAVKVGLNSPGN